MLSLEYPSLNFLPTVPQRDSLGLLITDPIHALYNQNAGRYGNQPMTVAEWVQKKKDDDELYRKNVEAGDIWRANDRKAKAIAADMFLLWPKLLWLFGSLVVVVAILSLIVGWWPVTILGFFVSVSCFAEAEHAEQESRRKRYEKEFAHLTAGNEEN